MQTSSAERSERKAERKAERREAQALAVQRPLMPALALPTRYFLGLGLLFLCLFLPALATLFRW